MSRKWCIALGDLGYADRKQIAGRRLSSMQANLPPVAPPQGEKRTETCKTVLYVCHHTIAHHFVIVEVPSYSLHISDVGVLSTLIKSMHFAGLHCTVFRKRLGDGSLGASVML